MFRVRTSFLQILTLGSFSDWVDIKIFPSRQAGFPVTVGSAASFSLWGCRVPSKALFTAKHLTVLGSFPNCSFKASRRKKKKISQIVVAFLKVRKFEPNTRLSYMLSDVKLRDPNFGRSVLGCIEADVGNQTCPFQNVFEHTRFAHLCTAPNSTSYPKNML